MFELLKYRNFTNMLIITVLVICIILATAYSINSTLKNNEISPQTSNNSVIPEFYEGKIVYLDPQFYAQDLITYELVNNGKRVILLRSKDEKLVVSEGQVAKVYGSVSKTVSGEDILNVTKLVLKNATN